MRLSQTVHLLTDRGPAAQSCSVRPELAKRRWRNASPTRAVGTTSNYTQVTSLRKVYQTYSVGQTRYLANSCNWIGRSFFLMRLTSLCARGPAKTRATTYSGGF